jgi:biotin transport system substrate-specific component
MAALFDASTVLAASALAALCAQVAIAFPGTPVPFTLQTLAVLLAGATLGSRRGALAMVLLLAEGAAGLPVFSGWRGGLPHLLGPTGGYLLGFVPAAYLTGLLAERGWDRRPLSTAAAMLVGSAAIYLVGLARLASFVGPAPVVGLGLLPFLPGDLAKIALATGLLPLAWRVSRPG